MTWPRPWRAAAILVSIWVLWSSVFVAFPRARVKLVKAALPAQQRVSVQLAAAAHFPGTEIVLVCRLRNTGSEPATIDARLGDRVLRQLHVAPGTSRRVDLAWSRAEAAPDGTLDLVGTTSAWVLEYAELANLHGFTRGAVEFLVLPAAQPFDAPGPWALALAGAWWILVSKSRSSSWPRLVQRAHQVLSTLVTVAFAAVAISPIFSPFRVVLATHTLVMGIALLSLPEAIDLAVRAGRWLAPPGLILVSRLASLPWLPIFSIAGSVTYGVVLWTHVGAQAAGADSSGYLNNARLLAAHRVSTPLRTVPDLPHGTIPSRAYVPLGFTPHGDDAMAPSYPIGLPLALAAVAPLAGWGTGPPVVMWLHALAGVALVFALARTCGLPAGAGLLSALAVATSAVYLFMSVQLMSDTPALVWTTAAVLLAWAGRQRPAWAAAAGVAMSAAVLVRPTNILVIVPVALCLGARWRSWAALIAGGAPGAALLAVYNLAAYGRAMTTGYGDASSAFSAANIGPSLRTYVTWLPVLLTPFGVLALGLPALVRRAGRMPLVLCAWAACFVAFYAVYFHTHEWWWYLRFLLPAFPPLAVGAVWVGLALLDRWPANGRRRAKTGAAVIVALLILGHNVFWARHLEALDIGHSEDVYPETAAWLARHLPPNGVVLATQASGALFYYTDRPIVRWDLCRAPELQALESHVIAAGRPLYAVFFPFEIEDQGAFDRIPGYWQRIGRVRDVTVWRLIEDARR